MVPIIPMNHKTSLSSTDLNIERKSRMGAQNLNTTHMKLLFPYLFLFWSLTALSQADVQKIDRYITQSQKAWEIPGMSVAIVKDGKVVLARGYGVKQLGTKEPVDENTLFAIASNTKAFIASAMASLVEQGQLSWDDRVVDHLPYFQLYDAYVTQETRILDLLCHRVGLGTFSGDLMWYKSTLSTEDVIRKIQFVPQSYGFRNGYGYSNLMFITAGEVIRSVTGQSWEDYVADTFFEPLEMTRTITTINRLDEVGNFAMPHKPFDNQQQVIDWVNWDQMGAAGGIISSAKDMSQWMLLNLNGGSWDKDTLLDKESLNLLWTPHNNFTLSEAAKDHVPGRHFSGYGLGWSLGDYYGNLLVTHSGGYDGMYSRVLLVPDQNLGICILTNTMKGNTFPLAFYILNQYLNQDVRDWSAEWLERTRSDDRQSTRMEMRESSRMEKTKPSLPDLAAYTGTYHSGMHGAVKITLDGDHFRMELEDAPALSATLTHWHYDVWEIRWDQEHAWFDFGTVQFLLDNNLKVTGLHFDVPNDDIFFDEVDLKKQ